MIFETQIISGSEKQIAWARKLQTKAAASKAWVDAIALLDDDADADKCAVAKVKAALAAHASDARFWIDAPSNMDALVSALYLHFIGKDPRLCGCFDIPHTRVFRRMVTA